MIKIAGSNGPIFVWVKEQKDLEDGCLKQAQNLASLPFMFNHVSLMPDTHQGYGMPIGGVLATHDVVIPNAVGVDIGCGMGYIQTNIPVSQLRDVEGLIKQIRDTLARVIPTGFAHHKEPQDWSGFLSAPDVEVVQQQIVPASYQLGTLGGGNHFIELQENEKGNLCLMLHSGSRNFGYKIAKYFNETAIKLNKRWNSTVPVEHELAFLPIESKEGRNYYLAMKFALEFAKENRNRMMERSKNVLFNMLKKYAGVQHIEIELEVNIHHNYVAMEHHYGKDVWVHRKGAIRMRNGEKGIIPGSQGTKSYIVIGKGERESFNSASHGAGRTMGRMACIRKYSVEDAKKAMEGIEYGEYQKVMRGKLKGSFDISESPLGYKDIDKVIENERDLVEVIHTLKPVASVKG